MKITWYPKNVLLTLLFLVVFGVALNFAIDFRRGAAVGLAALLVYVCLDVLLTFNAGTQWSRTTKWPAR